MTSTELPLVTIVTPSYNQGRFIRATIESVLAQGYPHLEYIVMDGGSKDETAAVCAEYGDRLTFISERDRGQSHAINKGFQMARGEIVAWLNSDDIFLPGAIDRAVAAMTAEPEVGFVYGDGFQIDVDGGVISRFAVAQEFDLWRLVHLSDYVLQQTAFFRRNVFERLGWIDESLHYGMDWEIFMRIGKAYPVRYLPYDMGAIREHGEAKTSIGGTKRAKELLGVMRRHGTMRWPPGAFVYGVPPYRELAHTKIEASGLPAIVKRWLLRATTRIGDVVFIRALERSEGLWRDGWAGKHAQAMVRAGDERMLRIAVELPTWVPIARQVLRIRVDGREVAHESFGHGAFDLVVPVPERDPRQAFAIELVAETTFRPAAPDRRRLAYLLREVAPV